MQARSHFMLVAVTAASSLIICQREAFAQSKPPLVSMILQGDRIEGVPLLWTPRRSVVLQRDGRLFDFESSDVSAAAAISGAFEPATQAELRSQLHAEFGQQYHISATSNYLVVHPTQGKQWPDVLERLHRAFLQYCGARGLPVRKARFPMVAIVFPDRSAFLQYVQSDRQRPLAGNVLGYYSRTSNRVAMYDHGQTSGGVSSTIRHEAAHQSAFNWGIHSRVAEQPHWIVEGVGTMFEADGIHDTAKNRSLAARVNQAMLEDLREIYPEHRSLAVAMDNLIADDRMFGSSSRAAYAASWAMTFYLADRRPDALRELLTLYAGKTPFIQYTAKQRTSDFQRVIGLSTPMLASQIVQFLSEVR